VQRLERLLNDTGRVTVAGGATDPQNALEALRDADVDVLFLDIQMPEMTGLELVGRLDRNIPVIFTTAYDRYALEAFDVNSIEYLLKPVETARLEGALDKLERLRGQQTTRRRLQETVMAQYLVALYHPDNYDPSTEGEASPAISTH
jgi:two-component system, LytTR family, response regulator